MPFSRVNTARVTSPGLPVADVAGFCVGATVAFCSGAFVAAEVHWLEVAVVVASGCDGCDVVGAGAHGVLGFGVWVCENPRAPVGWCRGL